jgi:glutamine cyclotransferase
MKNADQGWGLTHNGSSLIMSDGSSIIQFLDPKDFSLQRKIQVTDAGKAIQDLNELEYINGEIWANIWWQNFIVTIDPETGTVTSRINCTGLMPRPPEAFNGIAYDQHGDRIFVTGKLWPTLFQIKVLRH